MLHDFLAANRSELIDRCKSKAARRHLPPAETGANLGRQVPLLLDALTDALMEAREAELLPRGAQRAPKAGETPARAETLGAAARHGHELFRHGLPAEELAYCYGDLCQAIMDMALECDAPMRLADFRTLNQCLDTAIADGIRHYSRLHASSAADVAARASQERLGMLAHELRNLLHTTTLALNAIRGGNVGPAGATAGLVDRNLLAMSTLINRSLAEVRASAALPVRRTVVEVASFIGEVQAAASLEARVLQRSLSVSTVEPTLAVWADHDLLWSAVGNLLQNAFKFSRRGTAVSLHAYRCADRVLIDVADSCGGLPAGALERMFQPFAQSGDDRSGVGLGLAICRHNVEANDGTLRVRDIPGSGCIFTIDLPRHAAGMLPAEPALEGSCAMDNARERTDPAEPRRYGSLTGSLG